MTMVFKWGGAPYHGVGSVMALVGPPGVDGAPGDDGAPGVSAWQGMADTDNPDTGQPYIPEPTVPAMVGYFTGQAEAAGTAAAQAETAGLNARITNVENGKQDTIYSFEVPVSATATSGVGKIADADESRVGVTIAHPGAGSDIIFSLESDDLSVAQSELLSAGDPAYVREGGLTPRGPIYVASMGYPIDITIIIKNTSGRDPRMSDFLAKFPSLPPSHILDVITDFYSALGQNGLIGGLEILRVLIGRNEDDRMVSWVGNGVNVKHGTIAATAWQGVAGLGGYAGNGTDGYIDTGQPLPYGQFRTNDASMFAFISGTATSNAQWSCGNGGAGIMANRTATQWTARTNISYGGDLLTAGQVAGSDGAFYGWSRSRKDEYRAFFEETATSVIADYEEVFDSVTTNQRNLLIGALNGVSGPTAFSTLPVSMFGAGRRFADEQMFITRSLFLQFRDNMREVM